MQYQFNWNSIIQRNVVLVKYLNIWKDKKRYFTNIYNIDIWYRQKEQIIMTASKLLIKESK